MFTLCRFIRKERVEVGQYAQGWSLKYRDVLVLDDEEVGDVVGVVSIVCVLSKRQKDAEKFLIKGVISFVDTWLWGKAGEGMNGCRWTHEMLLLLSLFQ